VLADRRRQAMGSSLWWVLAGVACAIMLALMISYTSGKPEDDDGENSGAPEGADHGTTRYPPTKE
jgi:hypothetical protein